METKIFSIDPDTPDMSVVKTAADILKRGGLLAFPTETVYGLGADATDKEAAKKIYAAKGRPSDNPLIVHISDESMLDKVCAGDLSRAKRLGKVFWPGPLTVILPKSDAIPFETTGGLSTVAVRVPSRRAAHLIIRESGLPIAAPSANLSGRPSPTCAAHVIEDFSGRIDGIVEDGPSSIGVESTILDLTVEPPCILRRGFILKEEIEEALREPVNDSYELKEKEAPKAPGMKYKHYAPKGELYIVEGKPSFILSKAKEAESMGEKTAILCCTEHAGSYDFDKLYLMGSISPGTEIMQNLYATLRKLDEDGITKAYCESFADCKYGKTVMERLQRASAGRTITE